MEIDGYSPVIPVAVVAKLSLETDNIDIVT